MKRALEHMGVVRTAETLLQLNQAEGFDCMSCAWPDPEPGHRHAAEFCENGAKAVAEEATRDRATPEFFARHSIAELDCHSEHWLGQQGRITHPMVKRPGGTHYEHRMGRGLRLIGDQLNALDSPDEAIFYTSGRASNEAAFAYQLFVRAFGTNNLPDCSNMCHESTSIALQESIGIGKASVTMDDVYQAKLIVLEGQNPGTNHPRMLSALEKAKQNGAKILSINPLREAGLVNFKNPQTPRGMVGPGTDLSDMHLPIALNGDLALLQAFGSLLVEWDALDHEFIDQHTIGFELWKQHVTDIDWDVVTRTTGLSREQITDAARLLRDSDATVFCWAMGLTQHHNSVAIIKEVTNIALAQGNIGKPGAGLLPVRGHSNVQGDRTMGIWERPPRHFLDALAKEFDFDPPRENGYDTVDSIRAMRDGKAHFFLGLGGNFVQAAPDTDVTAAALRKTRMTVHVSTKINRSHLVCGDTALILPTRGRTEQDVQAGGPQFISVEDSTCSVHSSRGPLKPASPHLDSEVGIVTRIAEATIGDRYGLEWKKMRDDYANIRLHISRVVPGCEGYEVNVRRPGGFVLPHPPRDSRTFPTHSGRAEFAVSPIEVLQVPPEARDPADDPQPRSVQHHDLRAQRSLPRNRGRPPRDLPAPRRHRRPRIRRRRHGRPLHTLAEDDRVRCAHDFRIVEYDTPRGSAAAYYPETNPLVPLDSTAAGSNCPTSKSVVVSLEHAGKYSAECPPEASQDEVGSDRFHKSTPPAEASLLT